jgi:hypothetical protein
MYTILHQLPLHSNIKTTRRVKGFDKQFPTITSDTTLLLSSALPTAIS